MILIQGKVKSVGEVFTGENSKGTWCKNTVIIQMVDGNSIAVTCFNEDVYKAQALQVGDCISVLCRVSAREYNGNVYNDIMVSWISRAATWNDAGLSDLTSK